MNDEDDCSDGDHVAEHGEEYEGGGDEVVEEELMIFAICFSFDDDAFDDGEGVYSQLHHVEAFEGGGDGLGGPVGVLPVDHFAGAITSSHFWEPGLVPEEIVTCQRGDSVEDGVEAEFACVFEAVESFLSFVFWIDDRQHFLADQ